jgi:serine/threonine-protein kinase
MKNLVGRRFGNYRVLSLLGQGGMGAVYLARHPQIGREVAIKVLPSNDGDGELVGRFLNEARATAAVKHPNIVEILDMGTAEDGLVYLVMELLEGETLRKVLKAQGQLDVQRAMGFTYQVASALAVAHDKGIIHRDLKPENLFVVHDDNSNISRTQRLVSREKIKVFDFGLAKFDLARGGIESAISTRPGTAMGTPYYMSPEQCLGNRNLDGRTDIYSLGVILYEALCGVPPFTGKGAGQLMFLHMHRDPVPPRTLRPEIPDGLEALILKMLAKQPEDRPQLMVEVKRQLRALAGPAPASLTPPPEVDPPAAAARKTLPMFSVPDGKRRGRP